MCDTCDNHVAVHEGPVVQRLGLYEVREIATALTDVAGGVSYTEAARRVRSRYWGTEPKRQRKPDTVEGGQTVADWLHQFGPVISGHWAETDWPECVVADSTVFLYTDSRTKTKSRLFSVFAAWGYTSDTDTGRLWRLEARPTDTEADWAEFFAALPGRPRSIVCDRDLALIAGARRHFGVGRNVVPIHLCEHHLWERGMKALHADGRGGYDDELPTLLRTAFHSLHEWEAFTDAVATADAPVAQAWVAHWDKRMRAQTERRASLPAHHGNGAVEAPIAEVRRILDSRKWTFRNRTRMNLLLDLVRLDINRNADVGEWTAVMREHLDTTGGIAASARRAPDPTKLLSDGSRHRRQTLHR